MVLSFMASIIGIFVCYKGFRHRDKLHVFGFWFFILVSLSAIYSYLYQTFGIPALIQWEALNLSQRGLVLSMAALPAELLKFAGYIVLVIGLYKNRGAADKKSVTD